MKNSDTKLIIALLFLILAYHNKGGSIGYYACTLVATVNLIYAVIWSFKEEKA